MSYADLLRDPRWQRKRLEVMQRAHFACELCGDTRTTLNVHHVEYVRGRAPWEYSDRELRCLCEPCHAREHAIEAPPVPTVRQVIQARLSVQGQQAEYDVVRILVHQPHLLPQVLEKIDPSWIRHDGLARLLRALIADEQAGPQGMAATLDEEGVQVLQKVLSDTAGMSDGQLEASLTALQGRALAQRIDEIDAEIVRATSDRKDELTIEKIGIRNKLRAMGNRRWRGFA